MMKTDLIVSYLSELFPNPKCELNYNTDYELLIAIVLSAQTTDKNVNRVTCILYDKYDSLEKLSNASVDELYSILRPIGFKKKSVYVKEISTILLNEYGGVVPDKKELLIKLPGVGGKTANVFLSEYYNYPYIAVDTHVERVSKRLGLANGSDNVVSVENKLMKKFSKDIWAKLHLQLVLFGRYHCKAIKPECSNCKLIDICREKNKNI